MAVSRIWLLLCKTAAVEGWVTWVDVKRVGIGRLRIEDSAVPCNECQRSKGGKRVVEVRCRFIVNKRVFGYVLCFMLFF